MTDKSKESIQGVVFGCSGDAREHGKGGIWYTWKKDTVRNFPEDVSSVFFVIMPFCSISGSPQLTGIICEWTVDKKNSCNAQWTLSGTREKPTLSPSLNWVGMWHGWLQDGFLKSC